MSFLMLLLFELIIALNYEFFNQRIRLYTTGCKESSARKLRILCLAGAEGFEPSTRGFGDRCSTN